MKKKQDTQKTNELLRKLQASLVGERRQEKQTPQDADDAAFQAKLEEMLKSVTAAPEDAKKDEPSGKRSKKARSEKSEKKARPKKPQEPPKPEPTEGPTVGPTEGSAQVAPQEIQQETVTPTPTEPPRTEKHIPEALRRLTEDNPNAPEPKAEKAELKAEKAELKAEQKAELKAEKAEKAELKVEPQAEPKVEQIIEPKVEPTAELKIESKVEPKPEPKKPPRPQRGAEPIVIVPRRAETERQPQGETEQPEAVRISQEPIRIVPPTAQAEETPSGSTPTGSEEAVQEKKTPTAKQKDGPIVIAAPRTKGASASEPIVIKPREDAPARETEAAERETVSAQPIVIKAHPETPKQTETRSTDTKPAAERHLSGGVSLPRTHRAQPAVSPTKQATATRSADKPTDKSADEPTDKPTDKPMTEPSAAAKPQTKKKETPKVSPKASQKAQPKAATKAATKAAQEQKNAIRLPGRRPKQIDRTPIFSLPMDETLDEALDDTVDGAAPELLPMDAPERADVEREASGKRATVFSRRREKRERETADSADAMELIRKKTGLGEDDIAMILELGYDNELGRLVGYETLKRLRSEYRKKTHAAEHRRDLTAFGYRGEDGGTDSVSAASALAAYAHDRKDLLWRVVLTALCALCLAFLELPGLAGGLLDPYRAAYPWFFPLVSLAVLFGAAVLSRRQLEAGLGRLFRFTPTPYSAVALLVPLALLYGAVTVLLGGAPELRPIGFGTVCALLLTAFCDVLRLTGELRCLRLASIEGSKTVLEATEPRKKKLRHGERIVRIINDEIDQSLYRVRKSTQITGFFHRCNDFSSASAPFSILLGIMLAVSVLCGVLGAVRADSFTVGLSSFAVTLLYTVPTPAVLLYFYPLCRANRGLSHRNAALIGEGSVTEYSEKKTVIFSDGDLYPSQKCTQISVRDGEDFRRDMRLAGVLFRRLSGAAEVTGMSMQSAKDGEPSVALLRMTDTGAEALVDNKYHMLAGNAAFLGKNGVRIPRESTDRSARRAGNVSLMYVAIDGVLRLSYEIEYTVSAEFDRMAALLAEADTITAIRTYDPNLNEAFLRSSRSENAPYVRVIKPGRYEQDGVQSAVDSGVLALGRTGDVARPIRAAGAIVRLRRKGFRLLCGMTVVGAVLGAVTGFFSASLSATALILLPSLFRLVCDLVTALAVRVALPTEKE